MNKDTNESSVGDKGGSYNVFNPVVLDTNDSALPKRKNTGLSIYPVILLVTILVSLLELNLLGKGIVSRFVQDIPANVNNTINNMHASIPHNITDSQIQAFKPERIIIKKANIDLPVVSVPLSQGTWKVYPSVANYAEGTSLINANSGNVGIYGHDRTDAFTRIKLLHSGKGNDIIVDGKNYRATYEIISASDIAPTAVDVFYPTAKPTLTLITCDGFFSQYRFMVKAKLVKIEKVK